MGCPKCGGTKIWKAGFNSAKKPKQRLKCSCGHNFVYRTIMYRRSTSLYKQKQIIHLLKQKITRRGIALQVGVSEKYVYELIKRKGIKIRKGTKRAGERSKKEKAKIYYSRSDVKERIRLYLLRPEIKERRMFLQRQRRQQQKVKEKRVNTNII